MASLFEGTPQTATSYATSSTETPKWMQDAIYNQIQWATNAATQPYQPYAMPTVAELSPLQQQAYAKVQQNQGSWQPAMNTALTGMQDFTTKGTAGDLVKAQNQYLQPQMAKDFLTSGQNLMNKAGALDAVAAAQPYISQAANTNVLGAAQPYINQSQSATAQALSDKALNAANPYLQAASQSSANIVGQYMSPYQQNVMDVLAKQGARNLSENLLPEVSDAFIKAGQFGGTRMGEFGSRALRDTQEAILAKQAEMANQGYGQALNAAQADLSRQAGLAGTVGSISGADLSRILSGAQQYGNLGQLAGGLTQDQAGNLLTAGQNLGQLTSSQMQNLGNIGQNYLGAGYQQQNLGLNAASAAQQAQAQDYTRQISALSNMADLAKAQQGMQAADVAALESAGQAQQAQQQAQLNAAQQQYQTAQQYPKNQLDWLNAQIRGLPANTIPSTTTKTGTETGGTYSASPLATLASAMNVYKGLTTP